MVHMNMPNPLSLKAIIWGTVLMDNKMATRRKTLKKSEKEECTLKTHPLVMLQLDIKERRKELPLLITTFFGVYGINYAT